MKNNELKKKAEELEQTLEMQLNLAKRETSDYLKIGGAVVAGGLVAFTLVKLIQNKQHKKTAKILELLDKEGLLDEEIQAKLTQKSQPGFLSRLGAALLPVAINFGKEQLMNKLQRSNHTPAKDEE